jgi:AraC family transcriptional regulator of adaptative response/methylated-DNA-[protein]-cysteine methyltransferase
MQTMIEMSSRVSDDVRWQAVASRSAGADGEFYYAVRTTGIFCRPGCASKLPRRENVRFFTTPRDAQRAGYRPCHRCRPLEPLATRRRAHEELVARACAFIDGAAAPPSLAALATAVGVSPGHLQRVFKQTLQLSPKDYAAAARRRRTQSAIRSRASIVSIAGETGFSSTGKFYAQSPAMLGMSPSAFRARGRGSRIQFAVGPCSLGSILVAATERGVCEISLGDDPAELLRQLQDRFSAAELVGGDAQFEELVGTVLACVENGGDSHGIPLDIQGTAFQQQVWQALRTIPRGTTLTYSELAARLGTPRAVRAVASACAANRAAVAIPCHRVVRIDGALAGYRWGIERKAELLRREREQPPPTVSATPAAN